MKYMPVVWKTRSDGVRQRFNITPKRKEAVRLYKNGLVSRKVAEKLGISHARVLKILKLEGVERRSITKPILNPYHKKLTESRAYILGVMCGDGCVFSGIERKKKWEFKSYIVYLAVKDKDFLDEFVRHSKVVYGVEPRLYYRIRKKKKWSNIWIARYKRKSVHEDLAPYNFGGSTWKVPEEIINSDDEKIIAAFLRGFYDSEGSVSVYDKKISIVVCSTSKDGMQGVRELVGRLGIKAASIGKENRKDRRKQCYYFSIYTMDDAKKYLSKVGFSIKRKVDKIRSYIDRLDEDEQRSKPSGPDMQVVRAA